MTTGPSAVHFLCTADARVGFGHLRRCLAIAGLLQERDVRVSFSGVLDESALALIQRVLPQALEHPVPLPNTVVVDYMFDPQDMDFYDGCFLQEVRARHARVLLLTSAVTAPPDLPVDRVVGHMLESVPNARYRVERGLTWAPVAPEATAYRRLEREPPAEVRRVLLALGNFHDPAGLFLALDALAVAGREWEVEVLLPPALRAFEAEIRQRARGLKLEVLMDVPTVIPVLDRCDLLVGSYGNLTFEAMCLGIPIVIVAIKPFMARYAARLEAMGGLMLAGEVGDLTPRELALQLQGLDRARRIALTRRGQQLVDGRGLQRTADLIYGWINGVELPESPLPGARLAHGIPRCPSEIPGH